MEKASQQHSNDRAGYPQLRYSRNIDLVLVIYSTLSSEKSCRAMSRCL